MVQVNDKKQRIIDAAIKLFVKRGFEETSISDIANEADIAKGTVYLYFSSKDNLVEQVCLFCHQQDVEACDRGLEEESTICDKLIKRMRNAIVWAIKNPDKSAVERMYMNAPKYSRGSRYEQQTLHFQSVDKLMIQGIESKELKQLPSPLLGEIFFGIGAAYYFFFNKNPEFLTDEEMWETCREVVLDSLKFKDKLKGTKNEEH